MPFPEVDRVIYCRNLLDEVICQVRFSPILKIDTEAPAAFQDLVRSAYPYFSESSEVLFDIRVGSAQAATPGLQQVGEARDIRNYQFLSEDEHWKINLTRSFLALSTKYYLRWEDFLARFEKALQAFVRVYEPTSFTRVGLRYVDVIVRSKLGLDGVDWSELVQDYISGVLAVDTIKGEIKSYENAFQVELGEEGLVRVVTKSVQSSESGEHCYLIDSDFFRTSKMRQGEVLPVLTTFHGYAFNLFRWCIKDKLHDAMEANRGDGRS